MNLRIALGSDHAGYLEKEIVKKHLEARDISVIDLGTNSPESVDYPIYGAKVGRAVATGDAEFGIVLCGSGVGISIAANKVNGVRAALAWNGEVAKLARQHNDANVLSIGARLLAEEEILVIVDSFLEAEFEGGRHQRRVDEITTIETTGEESKSAGTS